jgi:hypothetical protein
MISAFCIRMAATGQNSASASHVETRKLCMCMGSHDSSVSIAIRCRLYNLGFESWQRKEIYLIFGMSRLAFGHTQSPTGSVSLGVAMACG